MDKCSTSKYSDIEFSGGYCYLHWLPSQAYLNNDTDIVSNMNKNKSIPTHCNSNFQGQESTVHDHFYGLGYRNPLLGSFGQLNARAAIDTPNRGGVLREGGSYFACGANAGYSNPRMCRLQTMCEKNKIEDITLYKD